MASLTDHLAKELWGSLYPERRRWEDIGESAREEWLRFVVHYERLRIEASTIAFAVSVGEVWSDVVKDERFPTDESAQNPVPVEA